MDGNEALKKLTNQNYSIILLDLNMPGIDGFQVINKLKEEHKADETFIQRVIIVSGGLGIDNIEKAKALGVKHFLAKPFDQKEFRSKVQKILYHYKSKNGLSSPPFFEMNLLSRYSTLKKTLTQSLNHLWWSANEILGPLKGLL